MLVATAYMVNSCAGYYVSGTK